MSTIFSRRIQPQPRALIAAAARNKPGGDASEATRLMSKREKWQDLCWDYFDAIGQVKYSMYYMGNSVARCRLYVAELDPLDPDAKPKMVDDADIQSVLDPLRDGGGSHAELLRQQTVNLQTPGECYLVGIRERKEMKRPAPGQPAVEVVTQEAEWGIRSVAEVGRRDRTWFIREKPADNQGLELLDEDFIARIWLPHPNWRMLPDSPLRGAMNSCEEILMIERSVRATARSRAAGAGVLLVPTELSNGPPDPATSESGEGEGEGPNDPFLGELIEAMITPIQDEGHANAVVPLIVRGSAEHLKEFRHLTLDRQLDAHLDSRYERALRNLAQGLNLPAEVVLGLADVNHWTAWQIDESAFKAHIEPVVSLDCAALTSVYLRPYLEAEDSPVTVAPERIARLVVWYDATDLVVRPNRSDDTRWAHEHLLISDESARTELGFADDDAITDEDELQRRIDLARPRATPVEVQGDGSEPQEEQIPEQPSGDEPPPGETAAASRAIGIPTDLGQRLANIDRILRERLLMEASASMRRALERIGATLRRRAQGHETARQAVANVGQMQVAATLGQGMVASLGFSEDQALEDAFDAFRAQFDAWVGAAQERALALVPRMSDEELRTARFQQARDRTDAWDWLHDRLIELARERLYSPNDEPPAEGEFDASVLIPYGIIREAVARAGGAAGPQAGAITAAAPSLPRFNVVLGLSTGWLLRALFAEKRVRVEGYEWVYGGYPRTSPFEPHEDLDGTFVRNFDDPALANPFSFPPEPYFTPGDHEGCVCDLVPVMKELA